MPSKAMCFYLFIYFNGCEWFSGRKYTKKGERIGLRSASHQSVLCTTHSGGGRPLRDTFMALNRMVLPQLVTKVTRWEAPREYERASDICLSRITLTCEIIPSAVPGRTTFWGVGGNVQVSMSWWEWTTWVSLRLPVALQAFPPLMQRACALSVVQAKVIWLFISLLLFLIQPVGILERLQFTSRYIFYHVSPWLRLFSKLN